jgi:hypothetical protein
MLQTLMVFALVTLASAAPWGGKEQRLLCRDGTVVWGRSKNQCRLRGGVERALPSRLARCGDGTVETESRRTCRYNGGVQSWL